MIILIVFTRHHQMTSTFGFTYIDAHFMYCEETLLFVINQIYNMPYLQGIKSFFLRIGSANSTNI